MYTSFIKIAELIVRITSKTNYISGFSKKYAVEKADPDIEIVLTDEILANEQKYDSNFTPNRVKRCEYSASLRMLNEKISDFDGFVLHASAIKVDDRGIAFCAKSGTGKTTHSRLWKKLLGDRLTVINGDKPIVRFIDDTPYVFGSPWNGKEREDENISAKLTDICFIERSEKNSVTKPEDTKEIIKRLSMQLPGRLTPTGILKNYEFLDKLCKTCKFSIIHCNMDISAAELAYNTIFTNGDEL